MLINLDLPISHLKYVNIFSDIEVYDFLLSEVEDFRLRLEILILI